MRNKHLEYGCCAVCDETVYLSRPRKPKAFICFRCYAAFEALGVLVSFPDDIVGWLRTEDPAAVRYVLLRAGYKPCLFPNDLDRMVHDRCFPEIPDADFWRREFWIVTPPHPLMDV